MTFDRSKATASVPATRPRQFIVAGETDSARDIPQTCRTGSAGVVTTFGDYGKVPKEDELIAALRDLGVPAGDYCIPCPRQ